MVSIALLTTGDEVVEGDILNTNAQGIARILTDAGFSMGVQVSCRDDELTIQTSMSYLLASHEVLIITGGLGPTADDRTRYAVGSFLKKTLIFHEPTWQWLVQRYERIKTTLPETNRQQAFFPEGATIITNERGSADGSLMESHKGLIIMLPGPPSECLPMMNGFVVKALKKHIDCPTIALLKWRVFGISESLLAQNLADDFSHFSKEIGYRWHYPYIDVKYRPSDQASGKDIKKALDDFLAPYIICANDTTASESLKKRLQCLSDKFFIDDQVTGGVLQGALLDPKTSKSLSFGSMPMKNFDGITVCIRGLTPYWQQEKILNHMSIELEVTKNKQVICQSLVLEKEPLNVIAYVTELISAQLKQHKYFLPL